MKSNKKIQIAAIAKNFALRLPNDRIKKYRKLEATGKK